MAEVLRAHGGWMDRDALAAEVAMRNLYRQRAGGQAPSDQLRLRARKYPHLFECSDSRCTRIRLRDQSAPAPRHRRQPPRERPPTRGHARDAAAEPPDALEWYDALREQYRPEKLEVLLIAESSPDPGSGAKRFFYAPELTHDNLYRGVAEAVYGTEPGFDVRDKVGALQRLKQDGYWLIDAVEKPINKKSQAARRAAIKHGVPTLVARCQQLQPKKGVIVCHSGVFGLVAQALKEADVPLLHAEPLPFPLGNWRSQFVAGFRQAVASACGPDGSS
jgi:hypothetical protein